jgi:hypothetical protein
MSAEPSPDIPVKGPPLSWEFQDEAYLAKAVAPPGYRPGGLTAVCIIAIILGALGLLGGLASLSTGLLGAQMQQWQARIGTTGAPAEMARLQTEMNTKMMQVANRYRIASVALAVFQLAVAVALLRGGIRAMGIHESGRSLLRWACGVAIAFELCRLPVNVLLQLENMAIMEDYFPRVMQSSAPGAQGDQIAEFTSMLTKFSTILGWVVMAGWFLLKMAFFGVALRYLGKPEVKALYGTK